MSILDRYILKQLILTLAFSLVALCLIFIIINLLENLDEFLDQNASFETIVKYYIHFLPEILKILTPVAVLISTLFTVGRLSNNNEITAMKSGGVSLYRLMIPIVMFGFLFSLLQLYFNGWIVPKANRIKIEIEQKYLGQRKSGGPIYNLYFRDNPQRNVTMQFYDSYNKTGNKIAVEDFSSQSAPRLTKRIEAERISWDSVNNVWKAIRGIEREFQGESVVTRRFDTLAVKLKLTHDQIVQLKRSPEEMNYDELRDYIALLKQGGKDVRQQLIEYYGNYAFPFASLIVVLFSVPFASVRRRGGIAVQLGAAMIISFLYLVFSKVSQSIGFAYNLDTIIAGWMANIIFFVMALVVIFKTRT